MDRPKWTTLTCKALPRSAKSAEASRADATALGGYSAISETFAITARCPNPYPPCHNPESHLNRIVSHNPDSIPRSAKLRGQQIISPRPWKMISGPLRAVHLSRHKWPGGLVNKNAKVRLVTQWAPQIGRYKDILSTDVQTAFSAIRSPTRQKSRVEHLKAKVEPLLTSVIV